MHLRPFNEGVDLPDVNTLLLLRPTQSPVLFEQQLGRGLRLAPDKECCLVLHFVGRYREEFRGVAGAPHSGLAARVAAPPLRPLLDPRDPDGGRWLSESRRQPHQSGKIALDEEKIELLLVTLDKAEGYHDRISYHDYAISPELFHWQTQNNAGPYTPAARRYLESPENGWRFFSS